MARVDDHTSTAPAMSFDVVDGRYDGVGDERGDPNRPSGGWWSSGGVEMFAHI